MAYNQPEDLIFLSTQTASNSGSLSFTSVITSLYPVYYVKIRGLLPATNATQLLLTFSTDNGSTYLASNYLWGIDRWTSNAANLQTNSSSDSSIHIAETVSNTSTRLYNGNFYLYGFGQSLVPIIRGHAVFYDSNTFSQGNEVGGMNSGTTAINAIKFAMSSGNITSGSITLYGTTL